MEVDMELAVQQKDSIIMNVRNQMARFAQVNLTPTAVSMNAEHYLDLKSEALYSTLKDNNDEDTICGLPIVISMDAKHVTVCMSPSKLRTAGLL
jgi:hypothetical protein